MSRTNQVEKDGTAWNKEIEEGNLRGHLLRLLGKN
jgi:hypothetical protein